MCSQFCHLFFLNGRHVSCVNLDVYNSMRGWDHGSKPVNEYRTAVLSLQKFYPLPLGHTYFWLKTFFGEKDTDSSLCTLIPTVLTELQL